MIVKLASNAFTRNWSNFSDAAKIAIGKSGALRSERRHLLGHIKGTDAIGKKLGVSVTYHPSEDMLPSALLESKKDASIIGMGNVTQKMRDLVGITGKVSNGHSAYLDSQIRRHEFREMGAGLKLVDKLSLKEQKLHFKNSSLYKGMSLNPGSEKHINRYVNFVQNNPGVMDVASKMAPSFKGHQNASIPHMDVVEALKNPHGRMSRIMVGMRKMEDEL